MNISLLLDYSEYFRGISPAGKQRLAKICVPKQLAKREILFHEGDHGAAMYVCATGAIRIYKSGDDGRESVIKIIGTGEIFAEVILFEKNKYPASADAVKKSLVYAIPKNQFAALLDDRAFRNDFIVMLMNKQRYLIGKIHDLTSRDVEERFFTFLAEQYGRKQEYRLAIPKKDIALAIGTTSETLSRLLASLQKKKVLTIDKSNIVMRPGFWK
jgi:CRP-like cAMP-binding protein